MRSIAARIVVPRDALTAAVEVRGEHGESVVQHRGRTRVGLLHRGRAVVGIEEVRCTVEVAVGHQRIVDPVAIRVLLRRELVALHVGDEEHVVVVVEVRPAGIILDADKGALDDVAERVLGLEEADVVALVRRRDVVGVIRHVGIGIGPGREGRTTVHRHPQPEGVVAVDAGPRHARLRTRPRYEPVRQQGLVLVVILRIELCQRAVGHIMQAEPAHARAQVGGKLDHLDRLAVIEPLQVGQQHLIAHRLDHATVGQEPLRHVGRVAEGLHDLRDGWLLAALGLELREAGERDLPHLAIAADGQRALVGRRLAVVVRVNADEGDRELRRGSGCEHLALGQTADGEVSAHREVVDGQVADAVIGDGQHRSVAEGLIAIGGIVDAREDQPVVRRRIVEPFDGGHRPVVDRRHPLDDEHVVVVVVIDARVVHHAQEDVLDGDAILVDRLEHPHGIAVRDLVALGIEDLPVHNRVARAGIACVELCLRRGPGAGRVEAGIGRLVVDLDPEEVIARPAIGNIRRGEHPRRKGPVAVAQRQQALVVGADVAGHPHIGACVARRMEANARAGGAVEGRDLGDPRLGHPFGDPPVRRQHLGLVGREVEVEEVQHPAAPAGGVAQTGNFVAEAEDVPDLVEVGLLPALVLRLPEAGQVNPCHRRVGIVGADVERPFEDAADVAAARGISRAVKEHLHVDRLAGRQRESLEDIGIGQLERAGDRGLEDLQRLGAGVRDGDRRALLVVAIGAGYRVGIVDPGEVQTVVEIGRIVALDLDVGIFVARRRAHVEIVERARPRLVRQDRYLVLHPGEQLDIGRGLARVPLPGEGDVADLDRLCAIGAEEDRQPGAIRRPRVGREIERVGVVRRDGEVELHLCRPERAGGVIGRFEFDPPLAIDHRIGGHEGVDRRVGDAQVVDIRTVGVGHADRDRVEPWVQRDLRALRPPDILGGRAVGFETENALIDTIDEE